MAVSEKTPVEASLAVDRSVSQPPVTRGLGVIAGLACAAALGLSDGIVTLAKTPSGTLTVRGGMLVLLHCAAVVGTFGLVIGALEELLLAAARRRPALRAFGEWAVDGPRRWFERNPSGTLGVLSFGVFVATGIAPLLPVSVQLLANMHGRLLTACAISLAAIFFLLLGAATALLAAWPLGWLVERAGRLASPGLALVVLVLAATARIVRIVVLNFDVFRVIDGVPAVMTAVAVLANLAVLRVVGAYLKTRGRPARTRTVGVLSGLAGVAFLISGLTFGLRQTVAATIFLRSEVTGGLVRVLQRVVDLDRDGYGALFGGGDCNDHDAHIHPGARDIPGNGIDENCTGADAHIEQDLGDGRMATVVGPLAGVQPSFVLLSVDAMRPDHMGAYGYTRPTTPHMDAFARGAAVFEHAYCTSPRSLRSFASIWTGRYPSLIEWGTDNQFPDLAADNATLAEQLTAAGYWSAAYNNSDYFHRTDGFFQGFSEWHESTDAAWKSDIDAEVSMLIGFVNYHANDARPFFVWAHMMEPHDPYRHWADIHDFGTRPIDDYDSEIAHADAAFGHVLRAVDAVAARRPIVVVLFSDHGEGFGEHGFNFHSSDLHQEQTHVALIIRGPGIAPGPRDALTSLMDLNPTILDYVGRPEQRPVDARSLVPVLQNPRTPYVGAGWRDHLFMEVTPDGLIPNEQKGLLAPPYELIYDVMRGLWQLYDLPRDPREIHNLVDDEPALTARMRDRLMSWVDSAELPTNRSDDVIAASRLPREPAHMDIPMHVRFGDVVELLGADIPTPRVRVGGVLRVVLYLRVLRQTNAPYWFHVMFHPTDGGGTWGHFAASHYPIQGRYSTTRWHPGEILRDEVAMRLEQEVRPTNYDVRMRVQEDSGGPVARPDSHLVDEDTMVIGQFDVMP